jgi:hypothetical protein
MASVAIERPLTRPSPEQRVRQLLDFIDILRQHNAPEAVIAVAQQALRSAEEELQREEGTPHGRPSPEQRP